MEPALHGIERGLARPTAQLLCNAREVIPSQQLHGVVTVGTRLAL
jgi:hypothetical protein